MDDSGTSTNGARRILSRRLRAHPLLTGGALVAGLATVVVVVVWFQPQTLLFDTVVSEDFPIVDPAANPQPADGGAASDPGANEPGASRPEPDTGTPPSGGDDTDDADSANGANGADGANGANGADGADGVDAPAGSRALATGSFSSRSRYTVVGEATTYELDDGSRLLRLEGFESTNGPDLYVYLTVADSDDPDAALDAEFVDLGLLTGNIGDQNYVIPADVDLDRFDTAVIWCRRFSAGFGAADLRPA